MFKRDSFLSKRNGLLYNLRTLYREKIKKIFDANPTSKIVIGSDFSDMMQNFGDKRASKGKDRYNSPNYINEIIKDLSDFFLPYADRIISFNLGNHELSSIKFHGVNIAEAIASSINIKAGTGILVNDFSGFYQLKFKNKSDRGDVEYLIYYSHRPISGGTRSKGMLSSDIVAGQYPTADMYIHEHIHTSLIHPLSVEIVNNRSGKRGKKDKWFIVMPTMKEEDQGPRNSYHHQKNYEPTWIGMIKLDFSVVVFYKSIERLTKACYVKANPYYLQP